MTTKIIFINRFFWPDESATSQILSDVAFDLAERGHPITIIASRLSYSDPASRYLPTETKSGVRIVRVTTLGGGKRSVSAKVVSFLSFYVSASVAAWRETRRGDILVAKTDPPLMSIPAMLIARLRGARFVAWLQDIYPELAAELGVRIAKGPIGRMLIALRNVSLRTADANVVIGERMEAMLRDNRVSHERIVVIPNWTADTAVLPNAQGYRALRAEWGLAPDDVVVGYSGNLGRAHDIDTLLDAASDIQRRRRDDIRFLFVGGGQLRHELTRRAAQRGLTNIICRPYVERNRLGQSMAVADIHWLSLLPALEGMIVPSKFYGIAASGRPAVFIGDPDGEIARLLREHDAGITCAIGDGTGLADQIVALANEPAMRERLGSNGRRAIETQLSQQQAMDRWADLVVQLSAHRA